MLYRHSGAKLCGWQKKGIAHLFLKRADSRDSDNPFAVKELETKDICTVVHFCRSVPMSPAVPWKEHDLELPNFAKEVAIRRVSKGSRQLDFPA